MKSLNTDKARHVRVRAVVAYPAFTVALVVSIALALTPFGTSQVMALGATSIPIETTAPTATATSSPTETTSPSATSTSTAGATPSPAPIPSATTVVAPGDHHVLARIEGPLLQANYLPVDEPVPDAQPHQRFRVRFRLHNAGTAASTMTPRLEYRIEGSGSFVVVPEEPELDIPIHVAREWIPSLDLAGGTMLGPLGEDIAVADLRIGDESGLALNGHRSMGANPDQPITLPPDSYTEEEFTVQLTMDATYLTSYELRITQSGVPLTGTDVATIRLPEAPTLQVSPDQHDGVAVMDPTPASTSAGAAYPLLSQSITVNTTAVAAVSRPTQTYPLIAAALSAATYATDIHGPYDLASGQCAICHSGHAAKGPNLLTKGSQSGVCLMCHDGTAANANVQAQYALSRPVNNPATRDYYSHDAVAATPAIVHTRSALDEFGGVSNRHSECADCHNSHKAKSSTDGSTNSAQTATGWDASGRLAGVSGVSVVNGAAGTAPTYTFLSGENDPANADDPVTNTSPINREYQLCFKCHSGFTTLSPPIAGKPSKDALDKAVEFNPANASFHPIEAAGKNQTGKMAASLAGASPYKLWNFSIGGTVRCLHCHSSGTTPDTMPAPLPLPGSALQPHTSSNRGILVKNYRDRVLSDTNAAYNNGDFALCYTCHSNTPFATAGGGADRTNFPLHGFHMTMIPRRGSTNTDIDTPGAGGGTAICAECHFRIHSTTNKAGEPGGLRLVSFAPNVTSYQPWNGVATRSWTPGATDTASCTLTCHGQGHNAYGYSGRQR